MAEGFAKLHGKDILDAWSSGSRPSGKVNEKAVELMAEKGIDLKKHQSKGLNDIPQIEWDEVITMGCGDACPFLRAKKRNDWNIPDPKLMPPDEFRKVRDLIETKVQELIKEISVK